MPWRTGKPTLAANTIERFEIYGAHIVGRKESLALILHILEDTDLALVQGRASGLSVDAKRSKARVDVGSNNTHGKGKGSGEESGELHLDRFFGEVGLVLDRVGCVWSAVDDEDVE